MTQRIFQVLLAPFLFMAVLGTASANPPARSGPDRVSLTAWLQVSNGITQDVIVEVEVNGTKDWGRPTKEGRIELDLPANEVAMIHFRKPGHLTKSVKVDTHNLSQGEYKGKRRNIDFEVVLEASADQPGLAYAGPVGTITFTADAGEMTVETDVRLIPVIRQQSIVF